MFPFPFLRQEQSGEPGLGLERVGSVRSLEKHS
jgi:hypothetical protein